MVDGSMYLGSIDVRIAPIICADIKLNVVNAGFKVAISAGGTGSLILA
jgi:hypothetical protein